MVSEPQSLAVDLSGLEFIDSTGVSAIYTAIDSSRVGGGKLGLLRGSPERTLKLMGVDTALPFFD
jgi:anti-anti-sigma regulatory factor